MEQEKTQNNIFKAMLNAFLMGLIGCFIFGLFYFLGIISFIGAYAIYILAIYGYKKSFNNEIDKKGYFITFLISLVQLILTIIFVYMIYISNILEINLDNAFPIFFQLLAEDGEFQVAVLYDFIISIVFMIIGLITDIITTKIRNNRIQENPTINENQNSGESTEGDFTQNSSDEEFNVSESSYETEIKEIESEIDKHIEEIDKK